MVERTIAWYYGVTRFRIGNAGPVAAAGTPRRRPFTALLVARTSLWVSRTYLPLVTLGNES
jgi:hypothetical protein